jgi:membrane-associated protein
VHAVATLLASLSDAIGELDGVEELMAYVVVMVMVAAEAIFPILPGETTVVTAANFASQGDLGIFWVFVAGWLGAMGGDLIGFGAGRLGSEKIVHWMTRAMGEERQVTVAKLFAERGGPVLVLGRFVPGLRILTALTAGSVGMPLRRYLSYEVPGAALWSLYASAIGYFVGNRSDGKLWVSLVVGFLATAVITLVLGRIWRQSRQQSGQVPAVEAEA